MSRPRIVSYKDFRREWLAGRGRVWKYPTGAAMAKRLGVSHRTIQRYISRWRSMVSR